ncbi:hypothetical protein [Solirubrobacter soli]|nr:hypothetical protein [Solirubrobacter soli]
MAHLRGARHTRSGGAELTGGKAFLATGQACREGKFVLARREGD